MYFIRKLLGFDVKDKIEKITGRASCCICSKTLQDNVYKVKDSNYFFCRKHAIQRARGRIDDPFENNKKIHEQTRESGSINIVTPCNVCKTKISALTGFHCKYCQKWFCEEHRLPERHECEGKPKNPHKHTGRVIYSKGKTTYHTK